ncbi:MAG: hypothetical protein IJ740_18345 [Ruminococcus sp.]|nr:hypothetical protein [Ruminococcus sp.]
MRKLNFKKVMVILISTVAAYLIIVTAIFTAKSGSDTFRNWSSVAFKGGKVSEIHRAVIDHDTPNYPHGYVFVSYGVSDKEMKKELGYNVSDEDAGTSIRVDLRLPYIGGCLLVYKVVGEG